MSLEEDLRENEEIIADNMKIGLDLLSNYAKLISIMPLEKWLEAFVHADSIGPILDPSKYRDYLYRGHGEYIKKLLRAGLELKKVVNEISEAAASGKIRI